MLKELFELHASIEERHWWFTGRREIVRQLLERVIEPGEGRSLVDLGCGTGGVLARLADEYACRGFDPSPRAIGLARARFPGVEFREASLAPSELPDLRDADGVLLLDVLEHVEEDAELLAAVVEGMRPGAHVLLTVPADPRLWGEHDVVFGHRRRYRASELVARWEGLPVTARLVSHYCSRLYPVVRLVRAFNRRRRPGHGLPTTGFEVPSRPVNRGLERCFVGEARKLVAGVDRGGEMAYRAGSSLVAVLRRE